MSKAKITKVYTEPFPASRFIGKRYTNEDRIDGLFSVHWGEWFQQGWFDLIDTGSNDPIGLMWEGDDFDATFQYWIGYFMPANTVVPEGFAHVDFPAGNLGVCWVHGKESDIYCQEGKGLEKLQKEGLVLNAELCNWCFERYACGRFDAPDKKGKAILDICFWVK